MRLFLFFIFGFYPLLSFAGLDEVTISTQNKACSIHYLSNHSKNNWSIKVEEGSCRDGWVDGMAKVEVYSPRQEKMETLRGFFSQGYWLDNFPPIGKVIDRTCPGDRIQALSFLLGEDSEAGITYIGQLRAVQSEGRTYGPFGGCPNFRVLVVVPKTSVFQNEAFLDKIVEQGKIYAHQYCVAPTLLALFGAHTPTNPEIVFQMQVDLETGEKKIIPVLDKKQTLKTVPEELREEKGSVLLSVKHEKEKTLVSYNEPEIMQKKLPVTEGRKKDILGHLSILSRVSMAPVFGRTVVHIKDVLLDGTGITDLPQEIQLLYYPGLKTGWAVIEGKLHDNKMQVSSVEFCQKEWCLDVP